MALAFAGSVAVALVMRAAWPSTPTLDAWAFLDWGRDIAAGQDLELVRRTFHPLPVALAVFVSHAGPVAAPLTVVASLVCLSLLAVAVAGIARSVGVSLPVCIVVGIIALVDPLLKGLGYVAYVNLPFATLVAWALLAELAARPRRGWALALLGAASLVRPEGWLFLVAYAVFIGWRQPAGRRLGLLALALVPAAMWMGLEAALMGDPFYSFTTTREAPTSEDQTSVAYLWSLVKLAWPGLLPLAVIAGVAAAARGPFDRRRSVTFLGAFGLALLGTLGLAVVGFNIPARHFSVVAALGLSLAAVGLDAPRRLARGRRGGRWAAAAGAAMVVAVVATAVVAIVSDFRKADPSIRSKYVTDRDLVDIGRAVRGRLPISPRCASEVGAPIAVLGVLRTAEVAWALDVRFACVDDRRTAETVVLLRPTSRAFRWLRRSGMSDRKGRGAAGPGFRMVARNRSWQVFVKRS